MFAAKNELFTRPNGGYNLSRSLRFRASATAYLNRTPASAGNRKTWTWSSWVKRGTLGANQVLFCSDVGTSNTTWLELEFDSGDTITLQSYTADINTTSAVFRDPSAWYHIVVAFDSTQATSANRCKIYVNGTQQTLTGAGFTLNADYGINNNQIHGIGYRNWASGVGRYFDGYMAEVNFIDGQALTPSSFGAFSIYNQWLPKKYAGTYGTNGFYLPFTNNTSAATLGNDFSGNSNTWTTNNISVTAGSTYDSMTDVPTLTSATAANYAVLNPLDNGGATISNANLTLTANGATHYYNRGSMRFPTSGKYYWESTVTLTSTSRSGLGVALSSIALNAFPFGTAGTYGFYYGDASNNLYWESGTSTNVFTIAGATGDVIQFAYDADNNTLYAGKNNVFYSSAGATTGNPSTLTNPTSTGVTSSSGYFPFIGCLTAGSTSSNFGQRPFAYTPPSGFLALNTFNL